MFHPSELISALRTRANRPACRAIDEASFWALYELDKRPLDGAPSALRSGPVELLVVITTYQRPDGCGRVLSALREAMDAIEQRPTTRVLVLNDRGNVDYQATRQHAAALFGRDLVWLDARTRLGKPGFWKAYQTIFLAVRALAPMQTLVLQDDIEFEASLLVRAREHFLRLEDARRPCVLNLFSCGDDEPQGRWVEFQRRDAGAGLYLTQWFDLCAFMADQRLFALLDYKVIPIHPWRWRRRPDISSGVGRQLTLRLFGRGDVYQTIPSLVLHGAHGSEMNAEARRGRPFDNRGARS